MVASQFGACATRSSPFREPRIRRCGPRRAIGKLVVMQLMPICSELLWVRLLLNISELSGDTTRDMPRTCAVPTRPRPRLDLPMRTNWPLINQYLSLICRGHAAPPHGQPTLLSRHSKPRGRLSPTALPSPATAPPALQPNQLCISQHTLDRDRPGAGKGSGARIQGTTPSGGGAVNSGPAGRLLAPDSSPKSPTPWRPETLPFRHLTHTPPLGLSSARAHPTSGETSTTPRE